MTHRTALRCREDQPRVVTVGSEMLSQLLHEEGRQRHGASSGTRFGPLENKLSTNPGEALRNPQRPSQCVKPIDMKSREFAKPKPREALRADRVSSLTATRNWNRPADSISSTGVLPPDRMRATSAAIIPPSRLWAGQVGSARASKLLSLAAETASSRVVEPNFAKTAETWFSTVRGDTNNRSVISSSSPQSGMRVGQKLN